MSRAFLESYGRRRGFAYVCESYKPGLRSDPTYRQWQRKLNAAILREMAPRERQVLGLLLEHRALSLQKD